MVDHPAERWSQLHRVLLLQSGPSKNPGYHQLSFLSRNLGIMSCGTAFFPIFIHLYIIHPSILSFSTFSSSIFTMKGHEHSSRTCVGATNFSKWQKRGATKGNKISFLAHFGPFCRALFRHLTELTSSHKRAGSSRRISMTLDDNW